jgi:hypothetical protein
MCINCVILAVCGVEDAVDAEICYDYNPLDVSSTVGNVGYKFQGSML